MSTYTKHGKTTSAKRNGGRKSTMTERDRRILRRIVSKCDRIIAAQVTEEVNILLEKLVFTKTVRRELHESNIHCRATMA
jgi:hypothetical protein